MHTCCMRQVCYPTISTLASPYSTSLDSFEQPYRCIALPVGCTTKANHCFSTAALSLANLCTGTSRDFRRCWHDFWVDQLSLSFSSRCSSHVRSTYRRYWFDSLADRIKAIERQAHYYYAQAYRALNLTFDIWEGMSIFTLLLIEESECFFCCNKIWNTVLLIQIWLLCTEVHLRRMVALGS